jgi:hypothetical protein
MTTSTVARQNIIRPAHTYSSSNGVGDEDAQREEEDDDIDPPAHRHPHRIT